MDRHRRPRCFNPLASLARALALAFTLAWALALPVQAREGPPVLDGLAVIASDQLPPEARETLALIRRGGPFPYEKDGTIFGNRERALPLRPRGYYTEYTVKTPGARNRGARRIVAGGDPARDGEYWYTDDHYRTFRRIRE